MSGRLERLAGPENLPSRNRVTHACTVGPHPSPSAQTGGDGVRLFVSGEGKRAPAG
jgi:hypothetical protein